MPYRPYTQDAAVHALAVAVTKEVQHRENLLYTKLVRRLLRIDMEQGAKEEVFKAVKETFGKNGSEER